MNDYQFAHTYSGQSLPIANVPNLKINEFRNAIIDNVRDGKRLVCLCADQDLNMFAILAEDNKGLLWINRTQVHKKIYPSLTPECTQAHMFERELAEQFHIYPQGHPCLKPVRFSNTWDSYQNNMEQMLALGPGLMDFYTIKGKEVHEVAVGPVHAGVIEPGHFRFQCHGETVLFLEIALGYQHRGIERAMIGGPNLLSSKYAETTAGDSTIAHTWAYCQLLEGLANITITPSSALIRSIALELERIANHVGDLGNLAGDVGFLPTSSFCGRIRGAWLNLTAEFCGSRMGRDWLCPGGLQINTNKIEASKILSQLPKIWHDTKDAINLMWNTASVLNRFEGIGIISTTQAKDIGLVGIPARACGLKIDVRKNYSSSLYDEIPILIRTHDSGDVYSRAMVRWLELKESYKFLTLALKKIIDIDDTSNKQPIAINNLASNSICVAIIEGWRGEVLHFATTNNNGRFSRYKIVDPSFHNWFGLTLALRNESISDFPLCNKSFNLSYCGHDL